MNHIGYEVNGPKRFVCRCEENLGPAARFSVIDGSGREMYEAGATRIGSAAGVGPWHYAGDFSAFREAGGDFRIRFEAGNRVATSPCFGLGSRILWRLTKPLAVQFMRKARAVRANFRGEGAWQRPGILPTEKRFYDAGGGWFDGVSHGGTSLRHGCRVLLGLVLARSLDDRDPQIRTELNWGADWLRRMAIKYPTTGELVSSTADDGTITRLGDAPVGVELVAGFLYTKISEILGDIDLLRRGQRFWREYRDLATASDDMTAAGAMLLSEAALHVATLEPGYLAAAERRAESLMAALEERSRSGAGGLSEGDAYAVAALAELAISDPRNPVIPKVKIALGKYLDSRVECSTVDPFGLVPLDEGVAAGDVPMRRAEEAWAALSAYRVTGRQAYIALAANAMNWLLGLNADDTCLVRGAGIGRGALGAGGSTACCIGDDTHTPAHIGGAGAYLMALSFV
jgi:hypothetical protein